MEHKEFKRIIEASDTAVLFIHGIAGTPNHFRDFIDLVPSHISVCNLLLDGHGKGVKDFSKTSMKKWVEQVQRAVDELSLTHKEIYIAAHSMGTLFAIEQAVKNPKITKLFLLAVPIKLFLRPEMFSISLRVYLDRIKPDDHVAQAAKNCYGIGHSPNPLAYIGWIPRFLELFAKIRQTQKLFPLLETPCTAYQSSKDEMVSTNSIEYLKQNSCISVVELKNSGHYYYEADDMALLLNSFQVLLDQIQ